MNRYEWPKANYLPDLVQEQALQVAEGERIAATAATGAQPRHLHPYVHQYYPSALSSRALPRALPSTLAQPRSRPLVLWFSCWGTSGTAESLPSLRRNLTERSERASNFHRRLIQSSNWKWWAGWFSCWYAALVFQLESLSNWFASPRSVTFPRLTCTLKVKNPLLISLKHRAAYYAGQPVW